MENRINRIITEYNCLFKDSLRTKINDLEISNEKKTELLTFIYDYDKLEIQKDQLVKRKRVKNVLPTNDRCKACRANGQQCTRRRKDDSEYCGTHSKGTPNGIYNTEIIQQNTTTMQIRMEEVNGIIYYVDNYNNVYDTEDIQKQMDKPKILGKFDSIQGLIS